MKINNKINYWKLVKSSRNLLKNKNFRNNQNYIISDFSKFKFSSKYYRSWFSKKIWKFLRYMFIIMVPSWILLDIAKDDINTQFLANIYFYICLFSFISFIFILFFILFNRGIYYYYKKFNFIKRKHIFASNRYIFLKDPKKNVYRLNRRDFISFKKD
jgi:hypothetical protein